MASRATKKVVSPRKAMVPKRKAKEATKKIPQDVNNDRRTRRMGRSKGKCLSENKEGLISLNNKLFCDVVRLLLAMNAYFVIIDQMDTVKSFFSEAFIQSSSVLNAYLVSRQMAVSLYSAGLSGFLFQVIKAESWFGFLSLHNVLSFFWDFRAHPEMQLLKRMIRFGVVLVTSTPPGSPLVLYPNGYTT
jgi:hypothetical protein